MERVAAFTDTYLPTVNGVSYTVSAWRDRWRRRGGRMAVVYPAADGHPPAEDEHPVGSLPFPFYDGFRLGAPRVPRAVRDVDVVHTHTPFSLGVAALRLARRGSLPVVASYHTPTSEYTDYLTHNRVVSRGLRRASGAWERRFFDRADRVLAPSEATAARVRSEVGVSAPVTVVPNGVDVEFFSPTDAADFRTRHDLPDDRPIVGYTGRHGYEKRLTDLVEAAADLPVTVLFGGDGPARSDVEAAARGAGTDARFLGFLDRAKLPAFYSALDVFAFPSPVETQGIVALEANACGTPVVGVKAGALAETVQDGVTGYHFAPGDVAAFRSAIERALDDRDRLSENCLDRRGAVSLERTIDRLDAVYGSL